MHLVNLSKKALSKIGNSWLRSPPKYIASTSLDFGATATRNFMKVCFYKKINLAKINYLEAFYHIVRILKICQKLLKIA